MNMKTHLILAWVAMAALLGNAASEDAIGFHGFLAYADGGPIDTAVPIKIDFSLYDAPTGGTLLWARRVPVMLDKNGGFYVDLRDAAGDPLPAEKTTLARALAAAPNGKTYLAYAPEGSTPGAREELSILPAAYFARTARAVDEADSYGFAVDRLEVKGKTKIDTLISTNEVNIYKSFEVNPAFHAGTFGTLSTDNANPDSVRNSQDVFYWVHSKRNNEIGCVVPFAADSECYVGREAEEIVPWGYQQLGQQENGEGK